MIIRDLPLKKIKVGLRVRSLACHDIVGTVVKFDLIENKKYFWIKWDNDERIYSGFLLNNCDCEVVEGDTVKIYLDDERETPEGWVRTYTVQDTIACLLKGNITHLSLDNDLGEDAEQGFKVLDWMEEWVYYNTTFLVPIITVHSSNESRKILMNLAVDKLEKIRQQQIGGR